MGDDKTGGVNGGGGSSGKVGGLGAAASTGVGSSKSSCGKGGSGSATVGLGYYAGWIFCTYVPYASDSLLDSPDQCDHFDTPLAPSNRVVVALEGLQVLAI